MRSRSKPLVIGLALLLIAFFGLYAVAASRYASNCSGSRASCLEFRQAGCSLNGEYSLMISGKKIDATCDMKSDGGGWTLIANYLHHGGHTPEATPRVLIDRLPLSDSEKLGNDETGTPAWGHASSMMIAAIPFHEARFQCRTTAHPRKVDFSVYSPSCLEYFRTGKGACLGTPDLRAELRQNVRSLEDHDAHLPLTADKGHGNQGDNSIVDYPFFIDWRDNWSVGGRWQCDDTQAVDKFDTHHKVWVR